MKTFIAILVFTLANQAFAAEWPQRLSDLGAAQLEKVQESKPYYNFFEHYTLVNVYPTVDDSAIVFYETEKPNNYDNGQSDSDQYYVMLYTTGESIRQVSSWANFGCHND